MTVLAGIALVAVCLQLALGAILAAVGLVSGQGRGTVGGKALLVLGFAAVVGIVGSVVAGWGLLSPMLRLSEYFRIAAGFDALIAARMLWVVVREAGVRLRPELPASDRGAGPLQKVLDDAADTVGLERVPRLLLVRYRMSPLVAHPLRPVLLFPEALADLDLEQVRIVMLHEAAHLKYRHLVWSSLASALAALIWPNPVGGWALRKFRDGLEYEADGVVRELDYSRTEIARARHDALAYLRGIQPALTFVAPEPEVGVPRTGLRTLASLALMPICFAGVALPGYLQREPQWLGFRGEVDPSDNPYMFQFSTPLGDWARRRYDIVCVEDGALQRKRGDNTNRRLLLGNMVIEPAVTRDGKKIAFIYNNFKQWGDLYITDGEGEVIYRLTDTPDWERHPSFSPCGTKLVYSRFTPYDFDRAELIVRDLNTHDEFNLTPHTGPGIEPSFSRDGKSILYMMFGDIYRVAADGSWRKRLTFNEPESGPQALDDHGPIESPDGKWILFTRVDRTRTIQGLVGPDPNPSNLGYTCSAWIMRADGTGQRQLAPVQAGVVEYNAFDIAPTGLWAGVAEVRTVRGGPVSSSWEIDILTGERRKVKQSSASMLAYTGFLR